MSQRCIIVPGTDPEVEVHGPLPVLAEPAQVPRVSALDLRDDRDRFAELANPVIDALPSKLAGTWYKFNSVACSIPDAIVQNRLIFHAGLPVMGISNLRWEMTAAQSSQKGELKIAEPEQRFPGRTGLLVGRSSFNYYHYVGDVLIFMEDLANLVETLGLDRVVINPCDGADDGFQRMLIGQIYPDLAEKVVFTTGPFHAEQLTFVCLWPGYFQHGQDGEAFTRDGQKGVARRAFRAAAGPFFERAERELGSRDFADRRDVVMISRRAAVRRKVVNEAELEDALRPLGVRSVAMEKLSVPEQMELMAGARVVMGPHGAGMINTGFCQSGALTLELTCRHYLQRAPMFATLGIVRNVGYHFVVGDEHGDVEIMKGNEGNDVLLSPRAIQHVVDLVDASLSADDPDKAAMLAAEVSALAMADS